MQALMELVETYLLPASLWLVMFSMGLSLVAADFGKIVRNSRGFVLGASSMLLLVPLVGTVIAVLFAPTPALKMGFILLATCPGGLLSNLLTSIAKGDLALSVSMSLFTSFVYVFTLPFIAYFALQFTFGETKPIDIPLLDSIWQIVRITAVPIAVGMVVRRLWERLALRSLPTIKNVATVSLVIIFGLIVYQNVETIISSWGIILMMVVGMNLINFLLALLVSTLGGLQREQRIAVVIEHLIRQEATAIYVAVSLIGRTDMSLPMIINTFIGMFVCVGFVSFMSRRRRREAAHGLAGGQTPASLL